MRNFFVKVCGITRPRDAELVCRLGANFLGIIFHPNSPRYVTRSTARQVVRATLPTVENVGVFVHTPMDQVLELADSLDLRYVQMHRKLSQSEQKALAAARVKLIQAVAIRSATDFTVVRSSHADLVLLDNAVRDQFGGTGVPFDWKLRPRVKMTNIVLAGGITAMNLAQGLQLFKPLVIDVNSGVETAPGIKSPAKLRAFFAKVHELRHDA